MKRSILFASFAAFLLYITASFASQQAPKTRIDGTVVRQGTGEPLARARVTLSRSSLGRGGASIAAAPTVIAGARGAVTAPKPIPPVMTDDQGKFIFQDLDEGPYTLQVLANGYVSLNYGQRYPGGPGTPIMLKAGQELKDLAVNLTPTGNISGRIRDRSDQPLANVPVQLMRYSYDAQGQRSYQSVGSAKTNDRGEYRIYWITPGRYYLMAGSAVSGANPLLAMATMIDGNATGANELPMNLGVTFYPGVDDIGSARAIDLLAGADLDSVNLTLPPRPPTHRIRGRIIDSRTGQPPARARVIASAQSPGVTSNSVLDQMALQLSGNNYKSDNGTFEIRDIVPGAYVVRALVQDPARGAPQQPATSSGLTAVAVSDSDVEGVVVTVVPAGPVTGRVRVDGQQQSVTPDRLRLQLMSLNSLASSVASSISGRPFESATPAADFTFQFNNIPVGDYRLTVQGQVAAAAGARPGSNTIYIKEARFDGTDVHNGPLRISGTASGMLDILIGVGGGQVTGTLTDRRSQPVPVTQVILIPDRYRDRTERYRTANTDENGRFNFVGIPPGDYKVFSWDGLEPYGWFDPELMAQSETKGVSVRVTDSSSEMIDVKLITREVVP
jgi:protocatechuate 3,4-dioxygenase beta subunit